MSAATVFVTSPYLVIHRKGNAWILSDPMIREHVEVGADALAAFGKLGTGAEAPQWETALANSTGWLRTVFNPGQGLWSDPTCLGERQGDAVRGEGLFRLLCARRLLVPADGSAYADYLQPLASVLDPAHLGSFNDRVGRYLIRDLRLKQSWRWWHDQKFATDGLSIRPGPYKFVHEYFFDRYFGTKNLAGVRVLDFACGNGHFAARFARRGANVVGLDTAPELIDLANQNHGSIARFEWVDKPENVIRALAAHAAGSFDIVYMGDVFLILAMLPDADAVVSGLLAEFTRLLAPGGRIYMLEPSGIFWLASRLGPEEAPMVMLTEYRKMLYNVAPTFDRVCRLMSQGGLALVEYIHPEASPDADPATKAFAERFPMWDFSAWMVRGAND
jgi:2-polyprenyl-3-methyl-5-hydroxy-6-metoxy-1,4-benzoquinol methylase